MEFKEENEFVYDQLFERKKEIENVFAGELVWERLDGKRACRIKSETPGNILDKEQWQEMMEFMVDSMVRMEKSVKIPLQEIGNKLKSSF